MKDKTLNNMSEEQMLKEIIEKAVERGWNGAKGRRIRINKNNVLFVIGRGGGIISGFSAIEQVIFDHSFLIAYFGEKLIDDTLNGRNPRMGVGNRVCKINNWKHHAMHLVWSEDRIKYLHRFI